MNMFKVERYVYLVLTILSFVLLLYAAFRIITRDPGVEVLISLFGSSGMIVVSSARIVYFFNKSFKLIEQLIGGMDHER
jgi:hypothetical protein